MEELGVPQPNEPARPGMFALRGCYRDLSPSARCHLLAKTTSGSTADILHAGDTLPDIRLVEPKGSDVVWSLSLRRPLLLYFFTTTCPYCAASRIEVTRLDRRLRETVDTIGIALDGRELAAAAIELNPVPWRVMAPANRTAVLAMGVPRVPTVVLVNSEARVVRIWTGQVTTATAADIARTALSLSPLVELPREE